MTVAYMREILPPPLASLWQDPFVVAQHNALDANISDHDRRHILADWYEEKGFTSLARAIHWQASNELVPHYYAHGCSGGFRGWTWWRWPYKRKPIPCPESYPSLYPWLRDRSFCCLKMELHDLVQFDRDGPYFRGWDADKRRKNKKGSFHSRRRAEEGLWLAWLRLNNLDILA